MSSKLLSLLAQFLPVYQHGWRLTVSRWWQCVRLREENPLLTSAGFRQDASWRRHWNMVALSLWRVAWSSSRGQTRKTWPALLTIPTGETNRFCRHNTKKVTSKKQIHDFFSPIIYLPIYSWGYIIVLQLMNGSTLAGKISWITVVTVVSATVLFGGVLVYVQMKLVVR